MLAKTHMAFSFLFALVLLPILSVGNTFLYFGIVLVSSILPDIDSPSSKASRKFGIIGKIARFFTKHRGVFHSLWIPLLSSWLFYVYVGRIFGMAFFIGYFSHLLIDGFTKAGINFLHPFLNLRMNGFVETGSSIETVFFLVFILLIIIKLVPFV